ncbi:intradiol ring-cleavage dioxygenase, partial [Streptomyces sp. SID3343]|uniref:intradiol ring-cleavage dioxygenase n=1 Tax=Streptomyces sp. SID3343 TaxID=2690260 RepID=UPI00136B601B
MIESYRDKSIDRRRFLYLGGAAAGLTLVGCSDDSSSGAKEAVPTAPAPSTSAAVGQCVLTSNVTEGPYYLDNALVRQDITEGKAGVPLRIRLTVQNAGGSCAPVPGAAVEIWHCDAWGYYSGFTTANPGGNAPAEAADGSRANDTTYLRGYQIAGEDGVVEFVTIFPGWYTPRVAHVHVKVHTGGANTDGIYEGGKVNHTGQLFFDDATAATVYALAPYNRHTGTPTLLAADMVYGKGGAKDGLTTLTPLRAGAPADGYLAALTLGIDPTKEAAAGGAPG